MCSLSTSADRASVSERIPPHHPVPMTAASTCIVFSLSPRPRVIPGLVPGIQPSESAGACCTLDPGDPGQFAGAGKHRDDTTLLQPQQPLGVAAADGGD